MPVEFSGGDGDEGSRRRYTDVRVVETRVSDAFVRVEIGRIGVRGGRAERSFRSDRDERKRTGWGSDDGIRRFEEG